MSLHLEKALQGLKRKLLLLSSTVENRVNLVVNALENRDQILARQVVEGDEEIDLMEVDIEEECQKILALNQPVAQDLRFIIASLKINNDLERIGDLAVNIAERVLSISTQAPVDIEFDFVSMAEKAKAMLRRSIDSLVNADILLAEEVCRDDDEVDALNRQMYFQVEEGIRQYPEKLETLIHLLGIARHIERIADMATNIAEDVIYLISARIVRHNVEDFHIHPRSK